MAGLTQPLFRNDFPVALQLLQVRLGFVGFLGGRVRSDDFDLDRITDGPHPLAVFRILRFSDEHDENFLLAWREVRRAARFLFPFLHQRHRNVFEVVTWKKPPNAHIDGPQPTIGLGVDFKFAKLLNARQQELKFAQIADFGFEGRNLAGFPNILVGLQPALNAFDRFAPRRLLGEFRLLFGGLVAWIFGRWFRATRFRANALAPGYGVVSYNSRTAEQRNDEHHRRRDSHLGYEHGVYNSFGKGGHRRGDRSGRCRLAGRDQKRGLDRGMHQHGG